MTSKRTLVQSCSCFSSDIVVLFLGGRKYATEGDEFYGSTMSIIVSSSAFCSVLIRSRSWMYLFLLVMSTQPRECEGLVPQWIRIPERPLTPKRSGMGVPNLGESVTITRYLPAGMTKSVFSRVAAKGWVSA